MVDFFEAESLQTIYADKSECQLDAYSTAHMEEQKVSRWVVQWWDKPQGSSLQTQ